MSQQSSGAGLPGPPRCALTEGHRPRGLLSYNDSLSPFRAHVASMFLSRLILRRLSRFIVATMLLVWLSPFGLHGAMAAPDTMWGDICTPAGVERHDAPGEQVPAMPHSVFDHCPLCLVQVGGIPSAPVLQLPRLPALTMAPVVVAEVLPSGPHLPPFDSRAPPPTSTFPL